MDSIIFLGTSDSLGVPRIYCDCFVCREARTTGRNFRTRCSVLLQTEQRERLLVDCGPDWRKQMERLHDRSIRRVLLTHPHHDHIGGLPDLADMARWTKQKVEVIAPEWVLQVVTRQYPWTVRNLSYTPLNAGLTFRHWHIHGWTVNHGNNGQSTAYRFECDGRSWVYCPDAIDLTEEQKAPMRGVNLLIIGTNFFHEKASHSSRSVYDVKEVLELVKELKPRKVLLTHLSHGIDVKRDGKKLPSLVRFAADGQIERV